MGRTQEARVCDCGTAGLSWVSRRDFICVWPLKLDKSRGRWTQQRDSMSFSTLFPHTRSSSRSDFKIVTLFPLSLEQFISENFAIGRLPPMLRLVVDAIFSPLGAIKYVRLWHCTGSQSLVCLQPLRAASLVVHRLTCHCSCEVPLAR